MKMKRYSAPDIRQAIAQVREELGPDAVILSNRTTDEGVELIAAIDYEESMISDDTPSKPQKPAPAKPAPAKVVTKSTSIATNKPKSQPVQQAVKSAKPGAKPAPVNTRAPTPVQAKAALAEMKTILPKTLLVHDEPEAQPPETQVSKEWLATFNAKFNMPGDVNTGSAADAAAEFNEKSTSKSVDQNSEKELKGLRVELNQLKDLLQNQISSMAWMDVSKTLPNRARLLKSLFEMGVSPTMGRRIAEKINFAEEFSSVWRKALSELTQRVTVPPTDIVEKGGVFALVGPTGVGKTTTIAKMAARYALNHGTKGIALITTDNYRIGAQEQLRTYGRILGAPVRVVNDAADLRKALKSLYDKQLILIDTAGMSQRDMRLTEQFAMLSEGSSLIKTYLVVSAAAQVQVLDETVQAYKKAVLDGCIISKVDESCSLGGVLSTVTQHQLPIAYLSDGQRVPEDLHMVGSVELVRRAVNALKRDENKLDDESVELMLGGYAAHE